MSAGVVIYPNHGQTKKCLLKNADITLYETKENGRDGYTIYNPYDNKYLCPDEFGKMIDDIM